MKLLITGGCGYIGSHMVRMAAQKSDISVSVLDTLENGHKEAIPESVKLYQGSTGDKAFLEDLFAKEHFDAVIHFAAYLSVEESVRNPQKYFHNNLIGPQALLHTMEEEKIKYLIFSSTAATYGYPSIVPIPEDHPKKPESPYGLSKWAMEEMLRIFDRRNAIRSISLRYFNASGAALDGQHGEAHPVETHIIPLAIQTALGQRESFTLYGSDYQTRDGSCERDYIHIEDLCTAHFMALDALMNGHETTAYNVATGHGVTNKELVNELKKQSGVDFTVIQKDRRPGDPDRLVADSTRIQNELGWKPEHSELSEVLRTAWEWHKNHPHGYEK